MKAIVSVVSGGAVLETQRFEGVASGKLARINAVKGARYVLAEVQGGVAVSGVAAKRVGKNLVLEQDSEEAGRTTLVIEDFFISDAQLVGAGADGEYLQYLIATDEGAVQAAAMGDGASALLTLASSQPATVADAFQFSEGAASLSSSALAGLAVIAGGVAMSSSQNSGGKAQPAVVASGFALDAQSSAASMGEPVPMAGDEVSAADAPALSEVAAAESATQAEYDNAEYIAEIAVIDAAVIAGNEVIDQPEAAVDNIPSAVGTGSQVPGASVINADGDNGPHRGVGTYAVEDTPVIEKVIDDHGVIQGVIENGGYTDDVYPTLMGHADPGVKVHVYRGKFLQGYTVADENGVWSYTPSSAYASGTHSMTVKYEYPNKDTSGYSEPYVITIDKIAPGIPQITGILDDEGRIAGAITDQTITDDNRPTITGTAEANAKLIVYDKGKQIGSTTVGADGIWSFTPDTPLADGLHMLSYSAVDRAGNSGEQSEVNEFFVDTRPEKINIYYAEDDVGSVTDEVFSGGVTDDSTPTLFGTATAGGVVKIYEGDVLLGQVTAGVDGTWQFTPPAALSEGRHTFHATVTLVAKGESERSKPFNLEVDFTAPNEPSIDQVMDDVGAIQGLVESGKATDDTMPTLSGKAEKGSTVYIYDNDSLLGEAKVDATGGWSFTPSIPLLDDTHVFTVKAVDLAGNLSGASNSFAIVIDTIPPSAPTIESVYDDVGIITGTVAQGAVTDDTTPTIKGTADAGSTVVIMSNGNEVGRVVADAIGQWSFTPSQAEVLAIGEHVLTAASIDIAGNAGDPSSTYTVTIDNESPRSVATITSMGKDTGFDSSDWVTNDSSAGRLIRGSLDVALRDNETLQVSTDGGTTWVNALVEGTRWSVLDMNSHAQSWNIEVRASSSTGLTGVVASQNVIFDQVAPNAPASVLASGNVCTVKFSDEGLRAGDLLDFVSNGNHFQHTLTAEELVAGVAVVTLPVGMAAGVLAGVIDRAGNVSSYRGLSLPGIENFNFDDLTHLQSLGRIYKVGSLEIIGDTSLVGYQYKATYGGTPSLWLQGAGEGITHYMTEFRLEGPANNVKFAFYAESSEKKFYFSFYDASGIEIGRLDYIGSTNDYSAFVDFKAPAGTAISGFKYNTPGGDGGGTLIDNMVITRDYLEGEIVPPVLVHKLTGEGGRLYGGAGDNLFELSDSDFSVAKWMDVQGGGGVDMLKFTGKDMSLDLTGIRAKVGSIEIFDITGIGTNALSLGLSDVLGNGAVDQFYVDVQSRLQMMVIGDAGDSLSLRSGLADGVEFGDWESVRRVSIAGVEYQSYQNSSLAVEVLVSQEVSVNVTSGASVKSLHSNFDSEAVHPASEVSSLLTQVEAELFPVDGDVHREDVIPAQVDSQIYYSDRFLDAGKFALYQFASEAY